MVKVKICGLSRIEDIDAVNNLLPDYIGFVFAQSRRHIDVTTAAMLKKRLDSRIKAVGVFVNEDVSIVSGLFSRGIIDLAQLHGDEDENYISRLKEKCGCPVIKAVGVEDSLPPYPGNADILLFDTLSKQRGGGGKPFNWCLLTGCTSLPPFFIAGGLCAHNVCEAVKFVVPFGVDVSSGVETNGFKDAEKIDEFIRKVRQA